MQICKDTIIEAVKILKSVDGENIEYDRALYELLELLFGDDVGLEDTDGLSNEGNVC